ncbi:MAG: leucyl aminopeptidase family protein [Myxococcota bacterium]
MLALDRAADAYAIGSAAARAFPVYGRKKRSDEAAGAARLHRAGPHRRRHTRPHRRHRAPSARRSASIDTPPSELHTEQFAAEAEHVARATGAAITVLRMDELRAKGMGGLVGVGQAAVHGPALVHLRYDPPSPSLPPVAWVGKGIVYDTGGLSLKPKGDMPGMKNDMGGAAAVLAAFHAAVELGLPRRIDAILCLAENSVGPHAMRPDDIITLYSGKTVEVNNTDAEGRLVLADGVKAFAGKDCQAGLIVDLATLTGAQLVATGKLHAAVVSNDEGLEAACVAAGKSSGDLCFALPYAPELFRHEFASPVADLRNSVKDRMNAQSSCAAQFVAESVDAHARWLHVDMAGPVSARDRGTGFGVALLLELFGGAHGV